MKNVLKKLLFALSFFCCVALAQTYSCSVAIGQTFNTLDSGAITQVFQTNYTIGIPPSGSIAVTTGVYTPGTTLDGIYSNAYFYYPAGAWTGSAAGFYYTSCSSTTTCLTYQNQCTAQPCTTPLAPTLVTTGAGSFTQTAATYIVGPAATIQGYLLGSNGRLIIYQEGTYAGTANNKYLGITFGGQVVTASPVSTLTGSQHRTIIINKGVTNYQVVIGETFASGTDTFLAVDTTQNQLLAERFYLAVATDFVFNQSLDVQSTK